MDSSINPINRSVTRAPNGQTYLTPLIRPKPAPIQPLPFPKQHPHGPQISVTRRRGERIAALAAREFPVVRWQYDAVEARVREGEALQCEGLG